MHFLQLKAESTQVSLLHCLAAHRKSAKKFTVEDKLVLNAKVIFYSVLIGCMSLFGHSTNIRHPRPLIGLKYEY